MIVDVPYEIGDPIIVDGQVKFVRGIHIFITENGEVKKYRVHIGNGKFVTLEANEVVGSVGTIISE